MADGIIFALIFILVCVIVWLSNREISISRARMRSSEKLLEFERNALELRISERTVEYVRAEEQRLVELQKNAEFGKLSQGLFHDLISPLSSVSLYAKQLEEDSSRARNYSEKDKEMIQTVIDSSRRMNSFMDSVRRSLQNDGTSLDSTDSTDSSSVKADIEVSKSENNANLRKEIDIVLDILGYKARMAGVEIEVKMRKGESMMLPIHPVRLHQLILNLVSNAIDACVDFPVPEGKVEHRVTVSVKSGSHYSTRSGKRESSGTLEKGSYQSIELSVSDTGRGISAENQKRLFRQAFTTKQNGSGIGLMTIKTIVERDLDGSIEVTSEEGKGAKFVVRVPYHKTKLKM